jgi:hypothetical protein
VRAAAAFTYLSVTDRSLASGKKMFDYLTEEQTRLFPRAAFEVTAEDLLAILNGRAERRWTDLERALHDDNVAVLFIRIPQIPSSRAFGTYPIASFDEYRNRVPADRSKWKIVPVDPRPFPEDLREPLPPGGSRNGLASRGNFLGHARDHRSLLVADSSRTFQQSKITLEFSFLFAEE